MLAAGVPAAFERLDYVTVTIGYTIMRAAGLCQWLRAGWEHPEGRATAFRFAFAVGVCQVGWLVRLALPPPFGAIAVPVLVAAELAGPVWAEGSGRMTPWHPEHVAELFGLFTLIVLGESVGCATHGPRRGPRRRRPVGCDAILGMTARSASCPLDLHAEPGPNRAGRPDFWPEWASGPLLGNAHW